MGILMNAADKFNAKAGQAIKMADENWEKPKPKVNTL